MSHDARNVANYLIQQSVQCGDHLTPLQINKVVYFCHGWMLGIHGDSLFWQNVEAWRLGPVVADVYHSLKHFGGQPVSVLIHAPTEEQKFNPEEMAVMDIIYNHYSHFSGTQLSTLTHKSGTPWAFTWNKYGMNSIIENDLIKRYFAARVNNRVDDTAK